MLERTLRAICKGCKFDITINGDNPKHELQLRAEASFYTKVANEILTDQESFDDNINLDLVWDLVEDKLTDNMNIKLVCPICGAEYTITEFMDMLAKEETHD